MTILRRPDRKDVERIIRQEASRLMIPADDVIGRCLTAEAKAARSAAINRILAETGCSELGLAAAWGISTDTVRQAKARERQANLYDANTRRRLSWAHGDARAHAILSGTDEATNADIAAWRALGSRSVPLWAPPPMPAAADTSGRFDLAREEP